jgi:hypothetical protein
MNNKRRKALEAVFDQLNETKGVLEDMQIEEEEYRDNIPENMQNSERYTRTEKICDDLEEAVSLLEEATDLIEGTFQP